MGFYDDLKLMTNKEEKQHNNILSVKHEFDSIKTIEKFTVDIDELKQYLNLYEIDETEEVLLETLIKTSIEYIKDYTGLSYEEIQAKNDVFKICVFLIVSDLYDNRGQQSLQYKRNLMLTSILDMYSINYL